MRGLPRGAALVFATVVAGSAGGVAYGQANSTFTIVPQQTKNYVAPNQDATVKFLLRETYTGTAAFFDAPANQLGTFEIAVDRGTTTPSGATAATLTASDADPVIWADTSPLPVTTTHAGVSGFTDAAAPTNPGGKIRTVSLGSVTIHGGTTRLAATSFQVNQTSQPDFFTASNQLLDTFINTSGSTPFTVTVAQNGDASLDGRVDVIDLGILATNYGKTSGVTWQTGDFTGDGRVDVVDLGLLATNYGSVSPTFAQALTAYPQFGATDVPEPAAVSALGVLGLGMLRRARRRPRQ